MRRRETYFYYNWVAVTVESEDGKLNWKLPLLMSIMTSRHDELTKRFRRDYSTIDTFMLTPRLKHLTCSLLHHLIDECHIWTNVQTFGVNTIFLIFKNIKHKKHAHQCCIYFIKYYLSKITVFYFNIFKSVIYSCDAKLNFQHFQSLLQSLVSHDPSEIILLSSFGVQKK